MPNELYYVDDSDTFTYALKTLLTKISWHLSLNSEGQPFNEWYVRSFMPAIDKTDKKSLHDKWYLLDIKMPVPKRLETLPYWPPGYKGDSDFCGIVLARWLVEEKGVDKNHVGLITQWTALEPPLLDEAKSAGVRVFSWYETSKLLDWLKPKPAEHA